ncbi:MAG: hypothetical protein EHM43_09195, partial [Ignavibacteriae bacterium]
MRTFEELKEAVKKATRINDAAALMECADELDDLATSEAEAVAHNSRGSALSLHGDYSAALEHFYRALASHDRLGNSSGAAGVTNNIGNVHHRTGNYPAALEHFHRALAVNEVLGNSRWVAINIANIGNVYHRTGNYPAALEHYYRALAIHEELGESSGVALVTGNIGLVHESTGNYPAALEHHHRALSLHEELGDSRGVAFATGNIGNVHGSTGNYPAALEHYHRALAMYDELGDSSGVANVTCNILSALTLSREHAKAEALLQTMEGMRIDNPGVVVQREYNRAALQEHHGNIDEARATLLSALLIAQEHTLASEQAEVHRTLRDLALKQNDLASYVEHNNEFTRITEEINGKDTATKLAMQEKQREIDAKDREHQKYMAVLNSTLPIHIASRVARGEVVNDHHENAAVIFLDIVGFTSISDRIPSGHVVHLLEQIFTTLDAVCEMHGVVKIKTIGDSYMAVAFPQESSSSEQRVASIEERAANAALDMLTAIADLPESLPESLRE